MKKVIFLFLCSALALSVHAATTPVFSTAGFYETANSGRKVYNMNLAWRFYKGNVRDAESKAFNDSLWQIVSLPHGLDLLPEEASGDRNYQGIAWYRKHFTPDVRMKGQKVFLHFEAIMGKSKIWVNGKLVKEQFGGYLPAIADVSKYLEYGSPNVIAVMTDNSNDPMYPPGKPQQIMDFAYHGGIYRDCWLVVHPKVYITDPNYENQVAGGGVLVWYSDITDKKAVVNFKIHVRNEQSSPFAGKLTLNIADSKGQKVADKKLTINILSDSTTYVTGSVTVTNPQLWSPDSPSLYWLTTSVTDKSGKTVDGYKQRIGIRTIEFKGIDGLYLNGKPYNEKLIGVNRHQDFAIVGNAMSNSLHYRDAKKLRDAGIRIIRSAHYPQDPAFMDACDELGMFIIVATPSWQFWNNEPIFEQRVISDVRNMVRRDRNHPSVFLWEPVLNETHYPARFAYDAQKTVNEEFPYNSTYSASDPNAAGCEAFPMIYTHPLSTPEAINSTTLTDPTKVYFTREWGDNVDDWSSNNSTSRAHRSWGEHPMLVQANHYANPQYPFTCLETLYETPRQHVGGTLWCGFDHSRGYHPQNFFGGLMDSYRQPKYSYYMFMAQRPAVTNGMIPAETGPMVYIAHEMSPFSSPDITVFSNCEEVRLKVFESGQTFTYKRSESNLKMPSPVITFKNAFDFMVLKKLGRTGKRNQIYLLAEGLINGKVVATQRMDAALKPTKLRLRIDNDNKPLIADGSDVVVVIAELTDDAGNVKRLNNDYIRFSVEGEGRLLQPYPVRSVKADWGSAPVLLQSTSVAGKIKIKAELECEGVSTAHAVELEIVTVPSSSKFIVDNRELATQRIQSKSAFATDSTRKIIVTKEMKAKLDAELKKVEQQQEQFGEKELK